MPNKSHHEDGPLLVETTGHSGPLAFPKQRFSQELWQRVERTVFPRIVQHPFLTSLLDGSLPESCFQYYIAQDVLYLREYSRALALVSGRAPRREWAALFAACSRDALQMELAFHKELLELLSAAAPQAAQAAAAAPSPNNVLYTAHLLSTIHERPFHEGLAAVLPCFLVYFHVGKTLRNKGSPHPLYQRWIDKYAGDEFSSVIESVESMVDEVALALTAEQLEAMHKQMLMGCRMEYLFWDAAYHQQSWPC
ncbi:hypothetical protein N2152v2_005350 [Parachlorella kessleri]